MSFNLLNTARICLAVLVMQLLPTAVMADASPPSCSAASPLLSYTFESGIQGWTSSDSASTVSTSGTPHGGTQALLQEARSESYYGPGVSLTGNLAANTTYVVRGWLRSPTEVAHQLMLKIDQTTPEYRTLMSITPLPNTWTRFNAFVRLTSAEAAKDLRLYVNSVSGKHEIRLDDVEILPPATCTPSNTAPAATDYVRIAGNRVVQGAAATPLQPKGINLVAYDDDSADVTEFQTQAWWNFDQQDLANIRAHGFNTLRLALWYRFFEDDSAPGIWKDSGFAWLDTVIAWARAEGLWVILDMHAPQGGSFQGPGSSNPFWTNSSYRDRYKALWVKLAERYRYETAIASYDLLNEPNPPNQAAYLTLLGETITAIRAVDPNHLLQVETCFASDCNPFVLSGTDNILYDFHFYDPWDEFTDHPSNVYPTAGTQRTKESLRTQLQTYSSYYTSRNLPFMVSEFGQKRNHFAQGGLTWVKDVRDLLDEANAHYCYFTYKGADMGLYNNPTRFADSSGVNLELSQYFKSGASGSNSSSGVFVQPRSGIYGLSMKNEIAVITNSGNSNQRSATGNQLFLLGLNPRPSGSFAYAIGMSSSDATATPMTGSVYGVKLTNDKTSLDNTVSCDYAMTLKADSGNDQMSVTLQSLTPVTLLKTNPAGVVTAKQKVSCVNALNVYFGYAIPVNSKTGAFTLNNAVKLFDRLY